MSAFKDMFMEKQREDSLVLYPKNYVEIKSRIIFFLYEKKIRKDDAELIYQALQKARTLVITSYKKNEDRARIYSLFLGNIVLKFSQSRDRNSNFYVTSILKGNRAKEYKRGLYKEKIFTIIPSGGVYMINTVDGNRVIRPESGDNSWSMIPYDFNRLVGMMGSYFDSEDETPDEEVIQISERFRRNVLRPFQDFTEKENWVEKYKQAQGEGLFYYAQKFERKTNKGNVYTFYSKDPIVIEEEEEERNVFNIGDRVTIMDTEHGEHGVYTGEIEDIDTEAEEGVAVSVAFYHQSDDEDFPQSGKIIMAVNDTQTRVRNRVIGAFERTKVESKYMYNTFSDFSTAGYESTPNDLKDYILQKLAEKYPPNQMQLEAIIKGILTEDILLVLGPPGTGKTTVINYWVEYFIKHGKRVLISSQNNSAVDNVLARFKGQGEIVRLGNEAKVQEDCKEFLPQYKIESMQRYFNANQERVERELSADWNRIVTYKEALYKYLELYQDFKVKNELLWEKVREIDLNLNKLVNLYRDISAYDKDIRSIEPDRAHKEIFLEEYNKKNAIVRWFRKKYAITVTEELASLEEKRSNLVIRYNNAATAYNSTMKELKSNIQLLHDNHLMADYKAVLKDLTELNDGLYRGTKYLPEFESKIGKFYTKVTFSNQFSTNEIIVDRELHVMAKIEEKARKIIKATKAWNDIVNNDRNDIMQTALLETCQIVGATCIGINSNRDFASVNFDVSIVDESGQIQIHNALIPMSRAPKNLLLGDYKQIPPSADQDVVAACKAEEIDTKLLEMSFFEYLFEEIRKKYLKDDHSDDARENLLRPAIPSYDPVNQKNRYTSADTEKMIKEAVSDTRKLVNLNRQFRMPENISSVISEWFYEGNYHSSYDMNRYRPLLPGTDSPLVVLSTSKDKSRYETQPQSKMGYMNRHEAEIVAEIVFRVVNEQTEADRENFISSIEHKMGIISAYGAQVRLIREYVAKRVPGITQKQLRDMVASLDSFQGQERPLIIYSLTRSRENTNPRKGRVGFMKELRRLNVAFTRAQQQLIIVGDVDYLSCCMNTQRRDDGGDWICNSEPEPRVIGKREILQCSECEAVCERKFARFIRLLIQHVISGEGEIKFAKDFFDRGA